MALLRPGLERTLPTPLASLAQVVQTSGPLWAAALMLDRLVPWGTLRLWPQKTVTVELLSQQVAAILSAWGMPPGDIDITVRHMLYADRHGIDSHGCSMLVHYSRELTEGCLTMTPTIQIVRETETTALVDGGGGLGHVPADTAMRLAIDKCRAAGMGAVAVRNSGHFGATGSYAAMATREGLIGVATTNTRRPAVVPTFGAEALVGTNPVAFAAPAGRNRPFLLDMATSTVPVGKLVMHWRKGLSIPAGWAMTPRGRTVRSGRAAALHRRLLPLGGDQETSGYKGYGLAVMVEILSSILPGAARSPDNHNGESSIGHFFLALDPQRFRDPEAFATDLDDMVERLRACRRVDPNQAVLVAGDPEYAAAEASDRLGIRLTRGVLEEIRQIAQASGAPFLLDARERQQ